MNLALYNDPAPKVIELVSHAQLSMKFIMLVNVKISLIVGILTLISMTNTSSESERKKKLSLIFQRFSFYEQLKSHAELS